MNTLSMSLSKDHINRLDEDDDDDDDSEEESEIFESLRNSRRQFNSKGELGATALSTSLRSRQNKKNNIEYFFEGLTSQIDDGTGTFDGDGEESKADS